MTTELQHTRQPVIQNLDGLLRTRDSLFTTNIHNKKIIYALEEKYVDVERRIGM